MQKLLGYKKDVAMAKINIKPLSLTLFPLTLIG